MLCCGSNLVTGFSCNERQLLRQECCFRPSYSLGCRVRAAARVIHCYVSWVHSGCQTVCNPYLSPAFPSHSDMSTSFRCFGRWISQTYLCVEQKILCWIIVVVLVTLRGRLTPVRCWHHSQDPAFLTSSQVMRWCWCCRSKDHSRSSKAVEKFRQ